MSRRGMRNYTLSTLYCPVCGLHMEIPRSKGAQRPKGHLKKLWCPVCKEEHNFVEVRYCDFTLEEIIKQ